MSRKTALTVVPAPFKGKEGQVLVAPDHELWMRAADNVHRTAADILGEFQSDGITDGIATLDLACIGAACVNQAMKSVAVAREKAKRQGFDFVIQPFFSTIIDDQDRERTRLMMRLTKFAVAA